MENFKYWLQKFHKKHYDDYNKAELIGYMEEYIYARYGKLVYLNAYVLYNERNISYVELRHKQLENEIIELEEQYDKMIYPEVRI